MSEWLYGGLVEAGYDVRCLADAWAESFGEADDYEALEREFESVKRRREELHRQLATEWSIDDLVIDDGDVTRDLRDCGLCRVAFRYGAASCHSTR